MNSLGTFSTLSQQESWVFPTFCSSQVLCSDLTVKLFLLREEGTGTQFPLLPLLNSLEGVREFLGPTNTHPSRIHQRSQNPSPTQPRAGIFLCFISFYPAPSWWQSQRFPTDPTSMRNFQFWRKKAKFLFQSEQDAVTAQEPPTPHGNQHQRRTGSKGRNFPHRNILQRLPPNWSSSLKDYKLFPEQRQRGLIPLRKSELGVLARRDLMGPGIPNPRDPGALPGWNSGLKGAFGFSITKRGVGDFQEASCGLGLEVLWGQHSTI